jgi:hypothetical protein
LTKGSTALIGRAQEPVAAGLRLCAVSLGRQLAEGRVIDLHALARWAVSRGVAGVVALAHGAHQGLGAVTVENARAAHVDFLHPAATDYEAS